MSDAIGALLDETVSSGDDAGLRRELMACSGLPGPRLRLGPVWEFARAVGVLVGTCEPPTGALERLLDGWAALSPEAAPGDQPAVILPCAAVAAYGEVGGRRPDWWGDETRKLTAAAVDTRWRVREVLAQAGQRLLESDWPRTLRLVTDWVDDWEPLRVRAAAATVAERRLLEGDRSRGLQAEEIQRRAAAAYQHQSTEKRRSEGGRALRQALGFTVGVTTAATSDFGLLAELAAAAVSGNGDPDLAWIVRHNLRAARLRRWPEEIAEIDRLLAGGTV